MSLPEHNLEREFALIILALSLQKHPDKAKILALNKYEDYMDLADDYKQLQKEFEKLQQENIRLKSSGIGRPIQLPNFLNLNRGNI